MLVYELFLLQGTMQAGTRLLQLNSVTPFMAFSVGDIIDLPNGSAVPIKQVHHIFITPRPSSPPQPVTQRVVVLV